MIKRAYYTATSWEGYSAQGPDYKEIENWWKSNWRKIPSAHSDSYSEWTNWYTKKYYGEWNHTHRGPIETLKEMKEEAVSGKVPNGMEASNRREKIKQRIHSLKERFEGTLPRIKNSVGKNRGIDFSDLSADVQDFLDTLGGVAKGMGAEAPFITSGHRSSSAQARVMADNWLRNGGSTPLSQKEISLLGADFVNKLNTGLEGRPISKGVVYLVKLYGNREYSYFVNNAYTDYGVTRESKRIVSDYIDANIPKNSHLAYPAKAVDLRLTKDIESVLNIVENSGEFDMYKLFEGDHFHVRIDGRR